MGEELEKKNGEKGRAFSIALTRDFQDGEKKRTRRLYRNEMPVHVAGSRGPSTPQTPAGMTQRKDDAEKFGETRANLTPNPFPCGKGDNRVGGRGGACGAGAEAGSLHCADSGRDDTGKKKEHRFAEILRLQRLPLRMTDGRRTKKGDRKRSGFFASPWNDTTKN